ncbi:MAG: TraR/DksA family transcriptional regulator [Candidatus Binataceae bacterium]
MDSEQTKDKERPRILRELLNHQRNQALAQVREYRRDQEEEATPPPGDEMDMARSLADVETHASLIERVEERLKAIDFAFERLNLGRYGVCAQCGEHIPVERLKALPFAAYCVDCQEKRNNAGRGGKPWIDEPFIHQWDVPEEMEETTETSHDEFTPLPSGEELAVPLHEPRPETTAAGKTKRVARGRRPRSK